MGLIQRLRLMQEYMHPLVAEQTEKRARRAGNQQMADGAFHAKVARNLIYTGLVISIIAALGQLFPGLTGTIGFGIIGVGTRALYRSTYDLSRRVHFQPRESRNLHVLVPNSLYSPASTPPTSPRT